MISGDSGAYLGLLSFLSFGFSVIAAVLAIDMYTLLRTGELGKTWRVLIIASVMFALAQVIRLAELLNWRMADYGLSQIVELVFVLALAYAFFLQRQTFTQAAALRGQKHRGLRGQLALLRAEPAEDAASISARSPSKAPGEAQGRSKAQDAETISEDDTLLPLEDDDDSEIEWSHSAPRKSRMAASASLSARPE
ncbi:MAG TPA: hypothetical protein VF600_18075 [Abditibacteriaceae bacterium]|jgi:hypothetical protein